jgi:hypothetical protein
MKLFFPILVMIALLFSATGCGHRSGATGSGVIATEERTLADFNFVQLVGSGIVEIKPGPVSTARLTFDDNLLTNISTRIEGPMLIIAPSTGVTSGRVLKVEVTAPTLAGVAIEGSGELSTGPFDSRNFLIRITGSGRIAAAGTTDSLEIKISGSGTVDATGMAARMANITIMGSGHVDLHATNQVAAKIMGTGQIRYSGNPTEVHQSISGGGSIKPR